MKRGAGLAGVVVVAASLAPLSGWVPAAADGRPAAQPTYSGLTPVPDPATNVPPGATCGAADPACTATYLSDINAARALEGVAPMVLPSNWSSLSVPQQLLVVENGERTARGLPPFVGLAGALDTPAQAGAQAGGDPAIPLVGARAAGAIFAAGFPNVLAADYAWMYDDGFGSANGDCTSPSAPGCWGHREVILLDPPGLNCPGCTFVAGAGSATFGGLPSYAGISAIVTSPLALDWAWNPFAEGTAAGFGQEVTGMASTPDGGGYWLVDAAGGVSRHGRATSYGSLLGRSLNAPISHIVATPDGEGYWLVAADGGTFAFGDAGFFGSMGGRPLNAPVVDLAPTPDGRGYWLVASDGGIFAFGDATFFGSMGGLPLNRPVVGIAADRATGGYWLVATDGGIFAFHAPFFGSTGNLTLNQPVNGMAPTADGAGYWFVASDGGIFAFGDAPFAGSTGALVLNAPIVGMADDPATGGYWLAAADGGIFAFGAPFLGAG